MKRLAVLTLLLVTMGIPASGTTVDGLAMMKIETGARPSGMGGSFVAIDRDPFAPAYNPANATGADKFMVSFGHIEYWENVRLETGYFAAPLKGRWSVHGGIKYASLGNIEIREFPTTDPDAFAETNDISLKAGLSYRFSDKVSAGFGTGWFIEKIEAWRGSAWNTDIGILVEPNAVWKVGASATNLGGDFYLEKTGKPGSRDISLPTTYRVGTSYRYQKYLGALDLVVIDDEMHAHLGGEARLQEALALRAGYMTNYDSKGITAGASFTHRNLTIDYAFVPYSNDLGTTHLFNFTIEL
ncbi:MAG: PorV/PorQ family protein [bacterium]|nr:PorV/PorQ family protein [bacterium]